MTRFFIANSCDAGTRFILCVVAHGPGNFRDVLQNRRILNPRIGSFNVKTFFVIYSSWWLRTSHSRGNCIHHWRLRHMPTNWRSSFGRSWRSSSSARSSDWHTELWSISAGTTLPSYGATRYRMDHFTITIHWHGSKCSQNVSDGRIYCRVLVSRMMF